MPKLNIFHKRQRVQPTQASPYVEQVIEHRVVNEFDHVPCPWCGYPIPISEVILHAEPYTGKHISLGTNAFAEWQCPECAANILVEDEGDYHLFNLQKSPTDIKFPIPEPVWEPCVAPCGMCGVIPIPHAMLNYHPDGRASYRIKCDECSSKRGQYLVLDDSYAKVIEKWNGLMDAAAKREKINKPYPYGDLDKPSSNRHGRPSRRFTQKQKPDGKVKAIELTPCNLCGNSPTGDAMDQEDGLGVSYYVGCASCGYSQWSGLCDSEEEAAKAWNIKMLHASEEDTH